MKQPTKHTFFVPLPWNNHFLSPICDVPFPPCNHRNIEEKKKMTVCFSFVMPLCWNVFVGHYVWISVFQYGFCEHKIEMNEEMDGLNFKFGRDRFPLTSTVVIIWDDVEVKIWWMTRERVLWEWEKRSSMRG